jgi:hypothetical protein
LCRPREAFVPSGFTRPVFRAKPAAQFDVYNSAMAVASIFDEHRRRNRTTRQRWQVMAPHRQRMMQLIGEARRAPAGSLCLLGAGNANDVDLPQLLVDFEQVVLVDLDDEALHTAVARLSETQLPRGKRLGGVDLTGLLSTLTSWHAGLSPSDAELNAAIKAAQGAPPPNVGTFEVVASTCVLSQLINSVYMGLGPDHPRSLELVMAVRNRHLEMLVELVKPGGAGILVTDFVSSETAPELAQIEDSMLSQAALRWLELRNFFTGTNPAAIRAYYQGRQRIDSGINDVRLVGPWRWDIGAKQFAVGAVTFRRAS